MSYTSSKKYGSTIQHYKKNNGDISYYITYKDENNKLKRIKIGEKSKGITESYCFKKRNEVLTKIRLGEDIPITNTKRKLYTFEKAFEHYLEWAKENKKTWKHGDYQLYHKHLAPYLAKKPLTSLKPKDFEDLKNIKLKENYKPKTVLLILGVRPNSPMATTNVVSSMPCASRSSSSVESDISNCGRLPGPRY